MVKEKQFISINEVLSRLLRHPLLQDITLEQVVQYTIDFIGIFGLPNLYEDKIVELPIKDYRTLLPCDLVSIIQVRNAKNGICLTTTSSSFNDKNYGFKVQGRILYTTFKEGDVEIAYKSIPVDKDGFPCVIDNSVFLKALENYIKKEAFSILFDLNKISMQVLQHAEQQYAWTAGQLRSELSIPSMSEMENIKNMWCSLIPRDNEFINGFSSLGAKEHIKKH